MLLLQRIAVTNDAPRLRCEQRLFQSMIREIAEIHLLLQVPQTCRVVFEALQSVRLDLYYFLVHFLRILILCHLKVASSNLCECPARLKLLLRQLIEDLDAFLALIEAKLEVGVAEDLQKGHHVCDFNDVEGIDEVLESEKGLGWLGSAAAAAVRLLILLIGGLGKVLHEVWLLWDALAHLVGGHESSGGVRTVTGLFILSSNILTLETR